MKTNEEYIDVVDALMFLEWLTAREISEKSKVSLKQANSILKDLYNRGDLEKKKIKGCKELRYKYP